MSPLIWIQPATKRAFFALSIFVTFPFVFYRAAVEPIAPDSAATAD